MESLTSTVVDILNENGIEASPLSGGTSQRAALRCLDPVMLRTATRILTASRLKARVVGSTLLVAQEDEEEDTDYEGLVASWKQFIQRSGDTGFRKAKKLQKIAHHGLRYQETLEAAKQIAETAWGLGEGSSSLRRFASHLRRAIRRAKRRGDSTPIVAVMKRLSMDSGTKVEDPNSTHESSSSGEKQKNLLGRRRKAGQVKDLYESAYRYLENLSREHSWSPQEIRNLGVVLGPEYEGWKKTLSSDVDDDDAGITFSDASDSLSHLLANDGYGDQTLDDGSGRQSVFGASSSMGIKHSQSQRMRITELLIEHYAADKHPEDLEDRDIRRFLKHKFPDFRCKEIRETLDDVLDQGIPKRGDE